MNVAGEILQHKNKKAPFIASLLISYCDFVFLLRQKVNLWAGNGQIKRY